MIVFRDLVYRKINDLALKMDIYAPPSSVGSTERPGVIFVHGCYSSSDNPVQPKDQSAFKFYGELVAAAGLIGVIFNHRYPGWDKDSLRESFSDVREAVRFVRENAASYHVDPDRLALWAFSGGGLHLSLPLGDKMSFIRCLVSYYATLDLPVSTETERSNQDGDSLDIFSPLYHLSFESSYAPPILIVRAGMDNPSFNEGVDRFIRRALATGETIDVLNHPQGEPGFDTASNDLRTREIIAKTLEFIRIHVSEDREGYVRLSPLPHKLYAMLLGGEIRKVKQSYSEALEKRKRGEIQVMPYGSVVREGRLNSAGYSLLRSGRYDSAVELFLWAVELYPTSPNAHDSLAEAYLAAGQTDLAEASAGKALQLLEKALYLSESRREAIRQSALEKIERLKKA